MMKKNNHEVSKHVLINFKFFMTELKMLLKSPVFILLTLLGNSLIALFCFLFYFIEYGVNPKLVSFIDALWWGFATATTTGYGDITPVTHTGKVLGILLMLTGTAIFSMFTALFAETFLTITKKQRNDLRIDG